MRTLKISLVATIASILAWQIRLPHKISPAHPYLMDTLLALIMCVVLQFAWSDPKSDPEK